MRGRLVVRLPRIDSHAVKRELNVWYCQHAKDYFQKRLQAVTEFIPWVKDCPYMRIQKMKQQWGSCSPSGIIILNPALIKASRECIEYVILHELCHLKEHNHSPRFYELLSNRMPDWKAVKSNLDAMAELLLS